MKRKPLVKDKIHSDPIPSVKAERRREAEAKAVLMEFEAIVWTSNWLPLTAVQVERVKEIARTWREELMLLASWQKFVKAHADFILLPQETRALLGHERPRAEMDEAQRLVNEARDRIAGKGGK